MKIALLTTTATFTLALGWTSLATAELTTHERVVHETTTTTEIELTPDTVLCSAADYSFPALKILIPELAAITLLDHQNFGAGAPCVAAGQCGLPDGSEPSDILDSDNLMQEVDIIVKAIRVDTVDDEALTCSTTLIERVDVDVRGVPFFHERYAELGSRPYADCAPPVVEEDPAPDYDGEEEETDPDTEEEGSTDAKNDGYGDSDASPNIGGCSTTGGQGSAASLLLLGFLWSRKRRSSLAR
jgi:uncharacterized protein (TIGR03382 family)